MAGKINKVVVIGAGPVGLLGALEIARLGIHVEVIDFLEGIDRRPRAAGYGPSAARILARAGVLPRIRREGLELYDFCWRKPAGDYIAGIQGVLRPDREDRYIVMPVDRMTQIIYEALQDYPHAKVHWEHKFTGVTQDDDKVIVSTECHGQKKIFTADFLLGCDGGRSGVRRALFGRHFPGHTWDTQIVATNLFFPGDWMKKHGWGDINWVIDPEDWAVVCKIEVDPDIWRVSYGEPGDFTEEELRKRCADKIAALLPGHPRPSEYELQRFSPYKLNNRCVPHMRVGRVLLAGDAAHLCNPMGGYGCTSGFADIGSLVDCLRGINESLASLKILDLYDRKRREIYYTVTDVFSTRNLKRLFLPADDALMLDPILQQFEKASRNPALADAIIEAPDNLTVDMTQYYDL